MLERAYIMMQEFVHHILAFRRQSTEYYVPNKSSLFVLKSKQNNSPSTYIEEEMRLSIKIFTAGIFRKSLTGLLLLSSLDSSHQMFYYKYYI